MHGIFKIIAPAAALVLVGCQQFNARSPYEYRFDDNATREVCVSVTPYDDESLRLSVRQMLQEQGFKAREVHWFDEDCTRCLRFVFQVGGWNDRIVAGSLDYTRLVHGNRYEASASEKLPEASFGAPNDDEKVLIRALLNRIFPQPIPWKE